MLGKTDLPLLQRRDFRDTGTTIVEGYEQRMVPPSHPRGAVRCRQEGLDFWPRQVANQFLVRPLHGDRQDTGDNAEAVGIS